MSQLTGDQLIGDTFQADQGTAGAGGQNPDGSYLFQATVALAQYGGEIVVTAGSGESVTAKVVGGSHDGDVYSGTIVANDASDVLVQTDLGFVYITNDPAAQPTPPADPNGPPGPDSSRTVGALGPNNPYTYSSSQPVCFASGTAILTSRGNIAVEALAIGDLVVTATGEQRPIRWLGQRTLACACAPRPQDVLPVKIAAHAFARNRPTRDLLVSPGHAICVEAMGEVLVPAGALVNGTTIVQVEVETITYWHVELDSHDIVLADGLATESYLEMGNRGFFAGATVVSLAAVPDAKVRTHADFCRPYVDNGPFLDAIRSSLRARAAVLQCAVNVAA